MYLAWLYLLPADLRGFVTDYESGLDDSVVNYSRYEFRLRAMVELAPTDSDAPSRYSSRGTRT